MATKVKIEDEPTIKVGADSWHDTITLTFKGEAARARGYHNEAITLYIYEVHDLIDALLKEANRLG